MKQECLLERRKMMFFKKEEFISPFEGQLIPIEDVNDAVFSKKLLGDGIAVIPSATKVVSPFSGEVSVAFETGHAYGIKSKSGYEVLLHLGIDTVNLQGQGFKSFVKQGKKVKQGDLLCEMDLDFIKQNGLDTTCMAIFTNGEAIQINENDKKVVLGEINIVSISKKKE